METLGEYNKRRYAEIAAKDEAILYNGIACPKCSAELIDSTPGVMLTSNPLQKNVHCSVCGYKGYAVI